MLSQYQGVGTFNAAGTEHMTQQHWSLGQRTPSQPARFQSRGPELSEYNSAAASMPPSVMIARRSTSAPPSQYTYDPVMHPHASMHQPTMTPGGLFVAPKPASVAPFTNNNNTNNNTLHSSPNRRALSNTTTHYNRPFGGVRRVALAPYYSSTFHEFQPFDVELPNDCVIEEKNNSKHRWTELAMNGAGLKRFPVSFVDQFGFVTRLNLRDNMLAVLPDELSSLRHLSSLDLSANRLRVVPDCITLLVTLRELSLQHNRIRELPLLLGRLYRLRVLRVDRERLAVPPASAVAGGTRAVVAWLRDRMPLAARRPPKRTMQAIASEKEIDRRLGSFSVLCYNVLAESYATSSRHAYCPAWALKWTFRRDVILAQLLERSADIICLQEVESAQYQSFFAPKLREAGYEGCFLPKSRARNMDDWSRVDGCATFYRSSRFQLLEEHKIEYQSMAIAKHKAFANDQSALQRLLGRDNIAVVLILKYQTKNGFKNVLVANTHIHWNPAMSDVKLMQVAFLLEKLQNLKNDFWRQSSVVICGDFNLTPHSGGFELLTVGSVHAYHSDFSPPDSGDSERDRAHVQRAESNEEEEELVVLEALEAIKEIDQNDNAGATSSSLSSSIIPISATSSAANTATSSPCAHSDAPADNTATSSSTATATSSPTLSATATSSPATSSGPDRAKFHYGLYTQRGIRHQLGLRSVYACCGHAFTNYTDEFVGCLDYIFYSPSLVPERYLAPLSEDDVRLTCLPSPFDGSDHLPICAQFAFALEEAE